MTTLEFVMIYPLRSMIIDSFFGFMHCNSRKNSSWDQTVDPNCDGGRMRQTSAAELRWSVRIQGSIPPKPDSMLAQSAQNEYRVKHF